MRLSTLGFSMGSLNAMLTQQSALAKLQNQVALGLRVSSPADDPIAAVHILELQRAQSESEQFAKNATLAKNRLSLEEQAIVDTSNVMTPRARADGASGQHRHVEQHRSRIDRDRTRRAPR